MSQDPLQQLPTATLSYATPQPAALKLKKVAVQQRAIMLCILAEIFLVIAQVVLSNAKIAPLAALVALVYLGVAVTAAVFIFMLAISLYNVGLGIVLGILTLVPILGLLVLLMVNGKATRHLRENGLKVGLLGADPSTIRG